MYVQPRQYHHYSQIACLKLQFTHPCLNVGGHELIKAPNNLLKTASRICIMLIPLSVSTIYKAGSHGRELIKKEHCFRLWALGPELLTSDLAASHMQGRQEDGGERHRPKRKKTISFRLSRDMTKGQLAVLHLRLFFFKSQNRCNFSGSQCKVQLKKVQT